MLGDFHNFVINQLHVYCRKTVLTVRIHEVFEIDKLEKFLYD